MSNLPFVEEILADLRRFKECAEDNQDVDLERDRFDLLVQLGLLERVQRSPARWMMTQAGEDAIAPPAAAHGDDAVRSRLCDAYERGYQDGQKWPDSYSLQADKDKVADELLSAMRAQGDGGAA